MLHLVIGHENLNRKKQFHLLLFMEKKNVIIYISFNLCWRFLQYD